MPQREVGVVVQDSGRDSDRPDAESEMTAVNLNKLPLLPTERFGGLLSALDHSPVIRETLRDYLELDIETLGIGLADSMKQEFAQRFEEINRAEEEIMKVQAINMRVLDDLGGNETDFDPRGKKCDLSEDTARKFNLIRFEDIMMDYNNILFNRAVDDNHLNCPLKELDECGPFISEERLRDKGETNSMVFEKKRNRLKQKKPERSKKFFVKDKDECCQHRLGFYDLGVTPLHNKWDDLDTAIISMDPGAVEFNNQKVGRTYMKKVRLYNVSNRMLKFEIRLEKNEVRNFDIMFSKPMINYFSLAPGMHMNFYVKFKCSDLDDHHTEVFVDVIGGRGFILPVRTRRLTPTLISEKFFFPSDSALPEFKKSSAITVDCGTRFLGTTTEVTAGLFNVGSEANYFITTEENWELGFIPDIQTDNTFSFSYFTVTPVLFYLDAGSKVNLKFTFSPTCERLFTEKLIILCDNFSIRSVDVIGEAVLFDPTHFCINAHSKTFDVDEEDLYDAVQCVDFGVIKKNSSAIKDIKFRSECPVEVDFHWELRQLPNWPEGYDIKAHQLAFTPNVGTLCALTTEEMEIACSTADMLGGVHKSYLCFVAKNVPKKCLIRDDIPGQRPQTEDMVMIDLMHVELRVTVAELQIELEPPVIIFRSARFNSQKYSIKAKNLSPWFAKVDWVLPESSVIEYSITPLTTSIPGSCTQSFNLELKGLQMGTIEELMKLECAGDGVCFHLSVRGEVINPDPPETVFLCHDIGPRQPGSDVSFEIPIGFNDLLKDYPFISTEAEGHLNFDWKRGDALTYKMVATETGFIPTLPEQVLYSTKLEKTEGTDLRLTSIQMEAGNMEFYTDTIALVQDVDVVLDRTEVDLGPEFYQRVPIKIKVTLINRNQLYVNFEWQPPTGVDARHFVVEYEPKQGCLQRLGRQTVEITLTADRPGNLDELILPCAMERDSKTLYLTCSGVAKDIIVQISYPYKENVVRIKWPKVPTTLLNVSEDLDMKDERCCICFISKFPEIEIPQSWGDICEPKILQFTDSNISLPPYENWPLIGGMYGHPKFKDEVIKREFYHSWGTEDLKRRMITIPMEEKSDLIKAFSQHALVFHINTYQTGNSKSIMIENLTPIHTRYDLEVQEFVECGQNNIYKDEDNCNVKQKSRESLIKMLGGEDKKLIDELCSKIQPNAGLSLSLNNGNGQLRPSERVAIDVTAFANCWGVYFDHIVIRIPELPPAIIPVLVVAEGPPVWFTMAPPLRFTAPRQDPTIRFHDVLSMSSAEQAVFVYNDSFLPVKLAWTTYVQRPPTRSEINLCLPDEVPDFSINLELHPTADDSFGQILLTDGYGDVDSFYYDVEPRVMYLKPKQMKPLLVKLNTKQIWFNLNHLVNLLKGAAHAYVYVDDSENNNEKVADGGFSVYRPDGPRLDPLVLRMESKVAVSPMRIINNDSAIFLYRIHSYDVTKTNNKIYTEERVYLFQNVSDTASRVKFSSTGHLRIRSAKVNGETHILQDWDVELIARPGDIVELKTELTVTEGDLPALLTAPSSIHSKRYEEGEHPLSTIVISHREVFQQVIPISIVIMETKIQLSATSLDFGEVFLNDSKGLSLTITCPFGEEAYSCKVVSGYKGVFRAVPESGIVSKNKYASVDVIFTPRECLNYYGMLMVTPSIEAMGKLVLIFGKGSWDHKNHQTVRL